MAAFVLLALATLLNTGTLADPLVVLQPGQLLRGKSFDYDGLNIDLFLGVPYAAAPIGDLRFQKPRPVAAWRGVKYAITPGYFCPQLVNDIATGSSYLGGNEDCLYLDITVPGGVSNSTKKPVMVWIHGGGYTAGSKDGYIGAPLAKHGDVIVVSINYRLGPLGFLSNGQGTGNYGLWDQREALVWLQANIAVFGGDPDMITIFGESAGAGSVAALTLGQHNNGLFKRAIQESGSMFTFWSWHSSERARNQMVQEIKTKGNCSSSDTVYKCLLKMTIDELFKVTPFDLFFSPYHPQPDGDFFAENINQESYLPSQSYDLMAGFCKQEGAISIFQPTIANITQEPINDGLTMDYVILVLTDLCKRTTPKTVDFCIKFFIEQYGLNLTDDDKERGVRLSFVYGELAFNSDTVRQLMTHSEGGKSTYAFQFSENFQTKTPVWPLLPPWAKISAYHTDEIPFVFGGIYNKENNISDEYIGTEKEHMPVATPLENFINEATASDKPLTDMILTMWTNFAKSGNPNIPQSLPAGIPQWPEFDKDNNQFMELNSTDTRVITTPHKDRLDNIMSTIFPARTAQIKADVINSKPTRLPREGKDAVVG